MDKVYIVIEEYNPYRAEMTIHGVFRNIEDAMACRRKFAEKEEREWFIDNPHSQLEQLNSAYYISEYEVQ